MLATIAIEGRDADQGGNGAAVQPAELGQFGEQRTRRGRPDAGHAAQQILLHAPDRAGLNRRPDLVIDVGDAPLEPPNVAAAGRA